jgi:protein SCO1/2
MKTSKSRRPLVLGVLGLAFALLGLGCSEEEASVVPECCAEDLVAAENIEIAADSVYQMDSIWTDQDGKPRRLREFAGKLQVAAMVFTHCEYACPQTLAVLKQIHSAVFKMRQAKIPPVHFLLLSIDPQRDTCEVLKAYAKREGLEPSQWTLLRADAATVRELAVVLGVRYKQNPDGNFAHSNLITLLDRKGAVCHRLKGLGAEPEPLIAAIRQQARSASR